VVQGRQRPESSCTQTGEWYVGTHPTPGPSPLAEARERGGDSYHTEVFPIYFDFTYVFPLPSPVLQLRGWWSEPLKANQCVRELLEAWQ